MDSSVHQRGVLVDGLDAQRDGVVGVPDGHRLAVPVDLARRQRHGTGDDLDERGLAGAVVTEQTDDLVVVDGQVDRVERLDAAVELGDGLEADQFVAHD